MDYICCSSIFTFGTKFCEPVQILWNYLSQLFFVFVSNKKNIFGTFDLLFISTLLTLTYYPLPALPTSQPVFILPQCLPCEPWTTDLWFSFGLMSWCLTSEPWRLECKFPNFLNNIYTVLVIHFPTLFKSDMYIGPSPSQS